MKESAKWRSGRDFDRTVGTWAGGRRGKSADAFTDSLDSEHRVALDDRRFASLYGAELS